jgi:hypothetical protein
MLVGWLVGLPHATPPVEMRRVPGVPTGFEGATPCAQPIRDGTWLQPMMEPMGDVSNNVTLW